MNKKYLIFILGLSFVSCGLVLAASGSPSVPGNLIANPQMQSATVSSTTPDLWSRGGYGTTTATYLYPVPGPLPGDLASQVTLSNYVSGAAEWYFQSVPVVGKNIYAFSDSYKSDIESYVIAQWALSDGSFAYDAIATLSPTGGSWANTPQEIFPAPANAVSLTILHLIQNGNGTLATTNYALTNYTPTSQGSFGKAMVSLTFDNGWVSQFNNGRPILNAAHMPSTYYIITNSTKDSTVASSGNLFDGTGISTSTITSASTINWGDITNAGILGAVYTDPTYQQYTFTETYTSTTTSNIIVKYCGTSTTSNCTVGNVASLVIGTTTPGNNVTASFSFTLPVVSGNTVTPISISQSPLGGGVLTVSNPSLIEYQEFMNESQLQTLQADGNEMDSHTETHPDLNLTTLSLASTTEEISGSRSALLSFGLSPADGFAYPFGSYNTNVRQLVAVAGYNNARTVDVGFNTTGSDPFLLKSESVIASSTLDTVQSWIDSAIANKLWLILTFHDVDPPDIIAKNNETYGVTPTMLQNIVSYLQTKEQSGVANVVTMDQGLAILNSVPPPTPTSTVPVVTDNSGGGGGGYYSGYGSAGFVPSLSTSSSTDTDVSTSTATTLPKVKGSVLGAETFHFTRLLSYGMKQSDVTELQRRLMAGGFFKGPITGYFGSMTRSSVRAYQKAHNLSVIGVVGPLTREALNRESSS